MIEDALCRIVQQMPLPCYPEKIASNFKGAIQLIEWNVLQTAKRHNQVAINEDATMVTLESYPGSLGDHMPPEEDE